MVDIDRVDGFKELRSMLYLGERAYLMSTIRT